MADIEATGASPPLPPRARMFMRAVAALGLLWVLTAQATLYGLMGVGWMLGAANAARIAARRLCGVDSHEVALAWDLLVASLTAAVVLFFIAVALALFVVLVWLLLRPWHRGSREGEAREVGGDHEGAPMLVAQGCHPESRGARNRPVTKQIGGSKGEAREIGRDGGVKMLTVQGCVQESRGAHDRPLIKQIAPPAVVTVLFVVMVVGLLMVVFAPAMGSCEQRVGSMLVDIGSFLTSLWFCFGVPKDVIKVTAAGFAEMREVCSELASLFMNPSRWWLDSLGPWCLIPFMIAIGAPFPLQFFSLWISIIHADLALGITVLCSAGNFAWPSRVR